MSARFCGLVHSEYILWVIATRIVCAVWEMRGFYSLYFLYNIRLAVRSLRISGFWTVNWVNKAIFLLNVKGIIWLKNSAYGSPGMIGIIILTIIISYGFDNKITNNEIFKCQQ